MHLKSATSVYATIQVVPHLHLYPVVALRLPHGYPNYIFQMYIASTGLSDLFFRQKELIPRTPSGLRPTPPNLVGDSLKNRFFLSSPKLGEVAHSAGGVCLNALMFLMFLCLFPWLACLGGGF